MKYRMAFRKKGKEWKVTKADAEVGGAGEELDHSLALIVLSFSISISFTLFEMAVLGHNRWQ